MKKFLAVAVLAIFGFTVVGCSALQKAQDASKVIGAILAVAQAEEPVIPAADQAIYTGFVNLGISLQGQLNTCIAGVSGVSKSSAFLGCFNTFASGLATPSELAQLRVLSSGSVSKVQLYLAGIIAGVNVAVDSFGGSTVAVPTVAPAPATAAQLQQLRAQIGY